MQTNFRSRIIGWAIAAVVIGTTANGIEPTHGQSQTARSRATITVAPVITSRLIAPAGGSNPACTVRQDPSAPTAPANANAFVLSYGATVRTTVVVGNFGLQILRITEDDITGDVICRTEKKVTWEEFWSNAETQDLVRGTAEAGRLKSFVTPSAPEAGASPQAITSDSIYITSIADSTLGSDQALFIAAAKIGSNPARLNWQLYRIQLISIDGVPFCMPSATASALNLRVGGSPLGRLFVAFDSIDQDFTTSGSILDIDVRSLLRGDTVDAQCFNSPDLVGLAPPDVRDDGQNAYFFGLRNIAAVKRYRLRIARRVVGDTLIATPDIAIPTFAFNPAAVQPNGAHLDAGGFEFTRPSIQIGNAIWNIHQIGDDGGHAKLRLYKFAPGASDPKMVLTLTTLPDGGDDLIAPSFDIDGTDAFVTFTRTIATDAIAGKATLMMARGPHSSSAGWNTSVLFESSGQFTKNTSGAHCDTFEFAGCLYGPNSATQVDAGNNMVWGFGEIITRGTLGAGGRGNEVNWLVNGIGVPR